MLRYITTSVLLLLSLLQSHAKLNDNESAIIIDSLKRELANLRTPADSIPILYDIFDISPRLSRGIAGINLYNTAKSTGNTSIQLDILRRLTTLYTRRDSMQQWVLDEMRKLPKSDERYASETYARLMLISTQVTNVPEKDRTELIKKLINEYSENKDQYSGYDRVIQLYTLCTYLNATMRGQLLTEYLDELGDAMQELPYKLDALNNLYYAHTAFMYSDNEEPVKSIEAYRQLLKIINSLERKNAQEGRKYRNYDANYYNCFRRMLRNSSALSESEIDDYYRRIQELAATNDDIRRDMELNENATMYYLMAKKRYSEALPILKRQAKNPENARFRRYIYRSMLEAAQALNDNETKLEAALGYNKILEDYLTEKSNERARELQVLYDVNSLHARNTELSAKNQKSESHYHTTILIGAMIAVCILVILAVLLFISYRRAKRLTIGLASTNQMLMEERDNLQHTQKDLIEARDYARKADRHKTEFINNMSHEIKTPLNAITECSQLIVDNIDPEKRKYLERFAQIVRVSADMLRTIINDVLDIAAIDNAKMVIERKPTSVTALCNIAIESIKPHVAEGVQLRFTNPDKDETPYINTDHKRVEQVLINLLNNSAKFTEEGFIDLTYSINPSARTITFAVTDSGIGIPQGKEEIIFERFEKLSSLTQGSGLGLNICRMIAGMLHGQVKVDTSYAGPGARFLFTIPV